MALAKLRPELPVLSYLWGCQEAIELFVTHNLVYKDEWEERQVTNPIRADAIPTLSLTATCSFSAVRTLSRAGQGLGLLFATPPLFTHAGTCQDEAREL